VIRTGFVRSELTVTNRICNYTLCLKKSQTADINMTSPIHNIC